MPQKIYTFILDLDFKMTNQLDLISRFVGEWSGLEMHESKQSLRELKSIATIHSVGASTRIEGSKMTNDEVMKFVGDVRIEKLTERDKQEVLGYFETLDFITESYLDIDVSINSLGNLHNMLMKYSEKDQWHKGRYKQLSNSVESTNADGTKTILFQTTPPGFETENAMESLIRWYNTDKDTPTILKIAVFVYEFLSIHPYQDGNGRLSRLLTTLLLLKQGYPWIQYVSFENVIENRKSEYYRVLMNCQQQRPGENVTPWITFFLDCIGNLMGSLKNKFDVRRKENQLSPRQKMIYNFIENHLGCRSGEIASGLKIPLPTVKKILAEMVTGKFLLKHGSSTGTNYSTRQVTHTRMDVASIFNNIDRKKKFILKNSYAFVSIKKIILTPRFIWQRPDEWNTILMHQNLLINITCYNNKEGMRKQSYSIGSFVTPYHYQPVFTLGTPIQIPLSLWESEPFDNEFPISVEVEIVCAEEELKFDVMLVYDASMG